MIKIHISLLILLFLSHHAYSDFKTKATNLYYSAKNGVSNFYDDLEGVKVGVGVLGVNQDSETSVDAIFVFSYSGYELEQIINDDVSLHVVPTSIRTSVNGNSVSVYTDAASLQYYGRDDLELILSAISLDYKKETGLRIEKTQQLSFLDFSAIKYFALDDTEVSGIDFYLRGNIGLGGKTKIKAIFDDFGLLEEGDSVKTKLGAEAGLNLPITDYLPNGGFGSGTDLNLYIGHEKVNGEHLDVDRTYIGLDLYMGNTGGVTYAPFIDYVREDLEFSKRFSDKTSQSFINFGIRVTF